MRSLHPPPESTAATAYKDINIIICLWNNMFSDFFLISFWGFKRLTYLCSQSLRYFSRSALLSLSRGWRLSLCVFTFWLSMYTSYSSFFSSNIFSVVPENPNKNNSTDLFLQRNILTNLPTTTYVGRKGSYFLNLQLRAKLILNECLQPLNLFVPVELWILPPSLVLFLTETLTGHVRHLSLKSGDVSDIDVEERAKLRNRNAHPRNGYISKAAATVY